MDLAAYLNATYYDPRNYASKLRLFEEATPALSDEAFEVKQKALRAALATVDHVGFSKASRGSVDV